MRRLDIDTQDLSHLLPEQRKVFRFIAEAMGRANIPVYFCEDKDVPNDLAELGRAELLRFSDNTADFQETLREAINNKGIVASGLESQSVAISKIEPHRFEGRFSDSVRQAKEWAQSHLVGMHTAKEGEPGQFSYYISKGLFVDKALSGRAFLNSRDAYSHLSAFAAINEIIRNSIDVEIHPDYEKEGGERNPKKISSMDRLVHRLYGAVELEGQVYCVKTTMLEYSSHEKRPYTYEVKDIKLSPGLPKVLEPFLAKVKGRLGSFRKQSGKGQSSGKIDAPTTGARDTAVQDCRVSAAKLLNNIEKSYDPGKKVLEESRKLDRSISSLFLNEPRVNRVLHKAKVYGWAKDGAVHLTQEGVNPYVAIHEYTHLWCYAMQRANAEGWDAVKNILKDHPMLAEVRSDSIYGKVSDENRQYAEALARISGYSGAERLEVLARKYRTRYGQVEFIKKAKEALSRCWDWAAKDLFGIKSFGEISEVCDRVIYDLACGRDFSEVIADSPQEGQVAVVKDFLPEKTKEALRRLGATDAFIRDLQEEGFSELESPYFRPKTSRDDTDIQRVSGGRLELFCNSQGEVFVTAPGGEHLSVREFGSRARADMSYVQRACMAQDIRNNQRDGKSLKERGRHRTGKTEFKQRII